MTSGVASPARLLLCAAAAAFLALSWAGRAHAGEGISPIGETFEVSPAADGGIRSPATLDFVVRLDPEDSRPTVWVSESAALGPGNAPAGAGVGSCDAGRLLPHAEPGKWVCRLPTVLLRAGRTYFWWLSFDRREAGAPAPAAAVSGPFPFTLVERAAPASTATADLAARLPSRLRFDGARSIKHARVTRLVYRTMKALGAPRQLAFACWTEADWVSVVEAEGGRTHDGDVVVTGFWLPRQPRWLHLSPSICTDVQALLDTRRVNTRRALALTTVVHETLHAYGARDEAQTNCFAVQLVPLFGASLGMPAARARYLGRLALNVTRRTAPRGYWHAGRCRDGGRWDLFPDRRLG